MYRRLRKNVPPLPEPFYLKGGSRENSAAFEVFSLDKPDKKKVSACFSVRVRGFPVKHGNIDLVGTLRIQETSEGKYVFSGDLYEGPSANDTGAPKAGKDAIIPIFSRKHYFAYLRSTGESSLSEVESGIDLAGKHYLDMFLFPEDDVPWPKTTISYAKIKAGIRGRGSTPWEGALHQKDGEPVAAISLWYVSSYLREATLEVDAFMGVNGFPSGNREGLDWEMFFREKLDWKLNHFPDKKNKFCIEEGTVWGSGQLHAMMISARKPHNPDEIWYYHILVIDKIDKGEGDYLGLMYDSAFYFYEDHHCEGAAVAAKVELKKERHGKCRGLQLQECRDAYFRTALHEMGHMLKLSDYHKGSTNSLMWQTKEVALEALNNPDIPPFPLNINWFFSKQARRRLCHGPDIVVRPAGVHEDKGYIDVPPLPNRAERAESSRHTGHFKLVASVLQDSIPYGAPVRITFTLANESQQPQPGPPELRMKSGYISAMVKGPDGEENFVKTILWYESMEGLREFQPGEKKTHAVTLFFGTAGPLFPEPGNYDIELYVKWYRGELPVSLAAPARVTIKRASRYHLAKARKFLNTSRVLLALAVGGDHLENENLAMDRASNIKVLKPHYSIVMAKRYGKRFFERPPDLHKASKYINRHTIMTHAEVKSTVRMLRESATEKDSRIVKKMKTQLIAIARRFNYYDELKAELDSI